MDSNLQMALKLWDLANLITGFAVAQILATTFALAGGKLRTILQGPAAHWTAFVVMILVTGLYLTAIVWCGSKGRSLERYHPEVWCVVTAARVGVVVLFRLVEVATLYWHGTNKPETQKIAVTTAPC
jgi:hypothetical protein